NAGFAFPANSASVSPVVLTDHRVITRPKDAQVAEPLHSHRLLAAGTQAGTKICGIPAGLKRGAHDTRSPAPRLGPSLSGPFRGNSPQGGDRSLMPWPHTQPFGLGAAPYKSVT